MSDYPYDNGASDYTWRDTTTHTELRAPQHHDTMPVTGADLSGFVGVGCVCILLGLALRAHKRARALLRKAGG